MRGHVEGAQRWYEKRYKLNRQLAEETDTPASRKDLFASCSRLGDIEKDRNNLSRAKGWYEESLKITGQCTYCGHCKPCPVNIDIAMVNKFYDLAVQQPAVPESVKAQTTFAGIPNDEMINISCAFLL